MNSRVLRFVFFALVVIAIGFALALFINKQKPVSSFPATVVRDCAPWDGAAFSISIRYDPLTTITVSIWKSPDMAFPSLFELPDEQTGNAYLLPELGPYTPLSGEVWFQRVEEGKPIHGRFSLTSERGEVYEGGFVAEWVESVAMCG